MARNKTGRSYWYAVCQCGDRFKMTDAYQAEGLDQCRFCRGWSECSLCNQRLDTWEHFCAMKARVGREALRNSRCRTCNNAEKAEKRDQRRTQRKGRSDPSSSKFASVSEAWKARGLGDDEAQFLRRIQPIVAYYRDVARGLVVQDGSPLAPDLAIDRWVRRRLGDTREARALAIKLCGALLDAERIRVYGTS